MKIDDISIPRVLLELLCLAFADMRDLVNDDGEFVPINELTDEATVAIQSASIEGAGERDIRLVGVSFFDKAQALDSLMRFLELQDAEALERIKDQVRALLESGATQTIEPEGIH